MKNLKMMILKLSWTVVAFVALILCISKPSNTSTSISASAATATPPAAPTVEWEQVAAYQRSAGKTSAVYNVSGMGAVNTSKGNVYFDPASLTARGSKTVSTTGLYLGSYVCYKAKVKIPAKTEFTVVYTGVMKLNQYCSSSSGTGYGWMSFYAMGDTDKSSSLSFNFNSLMSPLPAGVSGWFLNKKTSGSVTATKTVTRTYTNNTLDDVDYEEYFGLNTGDDWGDSYKYTHNDTVTMSSTVTFANFVGPKKPTPAALTNVYTGSNIDFAINDIDVNFLTKVEFSIGGNTDTLYSVDLSDPANTQVGNSRIINGALRVKDTGVYTLTFALNDTELWWEDGSDDAHQISVEITPKPIQMNWATQQHDNGASGADNFFFMLPTPDVAMDIKPLLDQVKYYNYSDFDAGTGKVLPGATPIDLVDIEEGKDYYAVVDLDFNTAGYNYELKGNNFCSFSTKDNRDIVVITIANSGEVYDSASHPAVANAVTTSGTPLVVGQDIDFRYTYFLDGDPQYEFGSDVAPVNAGEYKLVVEIKPNYFDDYKPYDSCEFTYVIDQANPVLMPILTNPSAKLYAGTALPDIVADESNGGTAGVYNWDTGQSLRSGIHQYSYFFVPTSSNYKIVTGMMELQTEDAKIQTLSATINVPSDVTIYDSMDLQDLREYITVSGVYNTGVVANSIYGYTISGTLTEGTSQLTIRYGTGDDERTATLTVEGVVASKLEGLSASFSQDGKIYTTTSLEDLKQWLEVKGVYNDG
ncbi:MAG: hypothetical protein K2K50_06170, partial [Anaeroplasmataceae bacterium]|nr:hypothetical protein [Anaeroplasmataceae bacterium]